MSNFTRYTFRFLCIAFSAFVAGCGTDYRLNEAARTGNDSLALALLDRGVSLNTPDGQGNTPLMLAVIHKQDAIANELMRRGASVDVTNRQGSTLLHLATTSGNVALARQFLGRGVTAGKKDDAGNTALHLAAFSGHAELVTLLLDRNAPVNEANKSDETALIRATKKGHTEIVKLLLARKSDVNAADEKGQRAIDLASRNGYVDIVRELIAAGADLRHGTSLSWPLAGWSRSPVRDAASGGHVGILFMLYEAGAEPYVIDGVGGNPYRIPLRSALMYDIAGQYHESRGNRERAAAHYRTAATFYEKTAKAHSPEEIASRERSQAIWSAVGSGITQAAVGMVESAQDRNAKRQARQQMKSMSPALAAGAARTAKQQGTGTAGAQHIFSRDYQQLYGAMLSLNRTAVALPTQPDAADAPSPPGNSTPKRKTSNEATHKEKQEASNRLAEQCKKLAACLERTAPEPEIAQCLSDARSNTAIPASPPAEPQ